MTEWLIRTFVKDANRAGDPAVHIAYGKMAGWVGIVCNVFLFVGKVLAGILSGSIAIVADAVNNLSDASSSIVTLLGFKMSAKPADAKHPFGHARSEYVAGLAVAIMVMIIGVELGRTSITKIISPTPVVYGNVSLAVLLAAILIKMWMARFNLSVGRRIGSATLIATYADSRNDVITTSVLLVAAIVARFTGLTLDGWMGLCVAVFILVSGVGLVRETLDPLLGEAPDPELARYVARKISGYEGVLGVHDLIVHDYGTGRRFASAHVEMASDADVMASHDIIDNIERDFMREDNIHLVIHYDPIVVGNEAVDLARVRTTAVVRELDSRLAVHDFRMVDGPTHANYLFDLALPPEYPLAPRELEDRIEAALQDGGKPIHTVITFDRSYL